MSVCAIINQLVTFFNICLSAWPTLQLTLTQMKLAAIAAATAAAVVVVLVIAILGMQETHKHIFIFIYSACRCTTHGECKCESNYDCKCKSKCILLRVFAPRLTNLSLPTLTSAPAPRRRWAIAQRAAMSQTEPS